MDRRPKYQEAYPCLELNVALTAAAQGKLVCAYLDEARRQRGIAFISRWDHGRVVLEYTCTGLQLKSVDSTIEFDVVPASNEIARQRWAVICPKCAGRKGVLVFKDEWACRRCHKLVYRSQLVDPITLRWERMEWLTKKVGKGRPKGIHHSTYAPLRAELEELRKEFRGRLPRHPSQEHSYLITSEWMRVEQCPIKVWDYQRFSVDEDGYPYVVTNHPWEAEQPTPVAIPQGAPARPRPMNCPALLMSGDDDL